jgi:hypothetical protein
METIKLEISEDIVHAMYYALVRERERLDRMTGIGGSISFLVKDLESLMLYISRQRVRGQKVTNFEFTKEQVWFLVNSLEPAVQKLDEVVFSYKSWKYNEELGFFSKKLGDFSHNLIVLLYQE